MAFGARMVEILGNKNHAKKNDWVYSSERKNKKNLRSEFVQLHEAFQYLLKRKFLQVRIYSKCYWTIAFTIHMPLPQFRKSQSQ